MAVRRFHRTVTAWIVVAALAGYAPAAIATNRPAGTNATTSSRPTTPGTGREPGTLPRRCPIFPASNVWNRPVDALPVAANSAVMIAAIGSGRSLLPDFSNVGGYGIPYNAVNAATPRSSVTFVYASESDRVRYPIPGSPLIEGGSGRHLIMLDYEACRLYGLFAAQ
jgi:hypothetical protein